MGLVRTLGVGIGVIFLGVSSCNSAIKTAAETAKNPRTSETITCRFFKNLIHKGYEAGAGVVEGLRQEAKPH